MRGPHVNKNGRKENFSSGPAEKRSPYLEKEVSKGGGLWKTRKKFRISMSCERCPPLFRRSEGIRGLLSSGRYPAPEAITVLLTVLKEIIDSKRTYDA